MNKQLIPSFLIFALICLLFVFKGLISIGVEPHEVSASSVRGAWLPFIVKPVSEFLYPMFGGISVSLTYLLIAYVPGYLALKKLKSIGLI